MTALRTFDIEKRPFDEPRRLANVVTVEMETSFLKHRYDARELHLRPGDRVIVETTRGPVTATVRDWVRREVVEEVELLRVLRKATAADEQQAERNRASEKDAYRFAIERVRARKLPMKLVRVQWMHDGSKIVFYFSCDGRVDFRDLVKDLAHRFRTRIEMHQIGVRDGTRMIGGIGPCGRELCCSTFLENFAPVSIRMAKDQGLTLSPAKVSGMCGRLMCCLVYEQQLYRKMKKRLPRAKTRVRTPFGRGKVIDIDIINQRLNVELDDGNRKLIPVESAVIGSEADGDGFVDSTVLIEPDYDWDDDLAARTDSRNERGSGDSSSGGGNSSKKKKSGRRRRRRPKGRSGKNSNKKSGKRSGSSRKKKSGSKKDGSKKDGSKKDGSKKGGDSKKSRD